MTAPAPVTTPIHLATPPTQGNWLTDFSQAGAGLATGFLAEKERQRKQAIDDAMRKMQEKKLDLEIETMRQTGRHQLAGELHDANMDTDAAERIRQTPILAQMDDARARGLDPNPVQSVQPGANLTGALAAARGVQEGVTQSNTPLTMHSNGNDPNSPVIDVGVSPYLDPVKEADLRAGKNYDLRSQALDTRRWTQAKAYHEKLMATPNLAMAAYKRVQAELNSGSALNTKTAMAALAQLAVPNNAREVNTVLRTMNEGGIFGGGYTTMENFFQKANKILTAQGSYITPQVANEIKRAADALMIHQKQEHDISLRKALHNAEKLQLTNTLPADFEDPDEEALWNNIGMPLSGTDGSIQTQTVEAGKRAFDGYLGQH